MDNMNNIKASRENKKEADIFLDSQGIFLFLGILNSIITGKASFNQLFYLPGCSKQTYSLDSEPQGFNLYTVYLYLNVE